MDPQSSSAASSPRAPSQSVPSNTELETDVAVIGGGVIGHAIAWEALRTGRSVVLVDSEPGRGASWAAAGMLAPVSELHYQEEDLLELMLESSARWPKFAAAFPPASDQESGQSAIGYLTTPTLAIGADAGDRQALADLRAVQLAHGLAVEPLTVREARSREALLSPGISCAFDIPTDHQVDPRKLLAAMAAAFPETGRESSGGREAPAAGAGAGSTFREKAAGLLWEEDRVAGVRLSSGRSLRARETVVANGLGAADLEGLPVGLNLPLRPVYGDIIRLRVPGHLQPLLGSTVRGLVHGVPVYIVPREDGTVVIGATQREDALGIGDLPGKPGTTKGAAGTPGGGTSSSANAVSAGGVYQLLRDAQVLVPAVAELELLECTTRARPGTPDNAPLLGRVAKPADGSDIDGLIIATGFFRHGILLAPSAATICRQLMDGLADPRWAPFRPGRFSGTAREHVQGVPPLTAQLGHPEPHSPGRKQHEYHA